jgi:hypothetical protein
MNTELKKAKEAIRKIERFCKGRPIPSINDVNVFIDAEDLSIYKNFAQHFISAIWEAEWVLHTKRLNKNR